MRWKLLGIIRLAISGRFAISSKLKTVSALGAECQKLSRDKRSLITVRCGFGAFFDTKHHFALHDEMSGFEDETEINEIQ